jgi:hypothetical protein
MARRSVSLIAGSAVLFGALTASAQSPAPESRPERPYRGVYASGTDQAAQVLTVNGSVAAGYDSSATLGARDAGLEGLGVNPGRDEGSIYNSYSAGLSYNARLDRFAAGASLSSSARQYPQLDVSTITSHAVSSGLTASLTKNTTVTAGAAATYQSRRGFSPFVELGDPSPGQVDAPSADYGTVPTNYYTYSTSAGLTQQLSRRSSLTLNYERQIGEHNSGFGDLTRQSGSFRFTRSLSRYLSLRLGYGYTEARYQLAGASYQNHNLDTGVDYSRDLSLTRRTRLSFSSGATAVQQDNINRYDVIGSARLSREIGRTWSAQLTYQRNVGYNDFVREPLFYDGLNVGIGGLINRRLSFQSGVGATRGVVGVVTQPSDGFYAVTGSAGVNAALTRHLALGLNYTFYHYSFEQAAALTTGLLPLINRHSVNVTLNVWAPVFQHGKRRNASR